MKAVRMRRPIWVAAGLLMLRTREQAISYLVAASVGAVLVFVGTIVVLTFLVPRVLAAFEPGAEISERLRRN